MLRGTGEAGGLCRAPLRCPRGFSGGPGPLRAPPPVCVCGLGTPRGLWVAPRGRGRAPFCGWADAVFQPVMSSAGIASRETSSGEAEEAKPSRNPSGAAPVRGYPLPPPPPSRAARSTQQVAPRREGAAGGSGRAPDTKGGSSELGSRARPSLGLPSAALMGIAGAGAAGGPQPSPACGCRGVCVCVWCVCFAAPGEK